MRDANIYAFWGFSLLRYIQKEFNRGFDQNDLIPRDEYVKMPKEAKIDAMMLRGIVADYSMLPRVILPEEVAEVKEEDLKWKKRSGVGVDAAEDGVAELRVGEVNDWTEFLVGPDIFLSRVAGIGRGSLGPGEVAEEGGSGIGRKLVGIEYYDMVLAMYDGFLGEEEIRRLGDSVMQVDGELKLRGKFVEALWKVSQYTKSCDRNALIMTSWSGRSGSGSCGKSGKSGGGGIMATSIGMDVLRGDYRMKMNKRSGVDEGVIRVKPQWCEELYFKFQERKNSFL